MKTRLTLAQAALAAGLSPRRMRALALRGQIKGARLVKGPTPYWSVPAPVEIVHLKRGPKPKGGR